MHRKSGRELTAATVLFTTAEALPPPATPFI
jgi:hypothetical protein